MIDPLINQFNSKPLINNKCPLPLCQKEKDSNMIFIELTDRIVWVCSIDHVIYSLFEEYCRGRKESLFPFFSSNSSQCHYSNTTNIHDSQETSSNSQISQGNLN